MTQQAVPPDPAGPVAPDGAPGVVIPDGSADVLKAALLARRAADQHERDVLRLAYQWAVLHETGSYDDAAIALLPGMSDPDGIGIAGDGCPWVLQDAVAEFAAVVGLSTSQGMRLVGDAQELAHRLPRTWAKVLAGTCRAWKARRIADQTRHLSAEAAGFVDSQVHWCVDTLGPIQLDRLVYVAKARHMPDQLDAEIEAAFDGRHVTVTPDQVSCNGTIRITAEVEMGDAWDFETAVSSGASQLQHLGSTDTLDGRRASAVGEMPRRQLAFLFEETDHPAQGYDDTSACERPDGDRIPASVKAPATLSRRLNLYVHLSADAMESPGRGIGRSEGSFGSGVITTDQVRAWSGLPGMSVTVRPVIDLAGRLHAIGYEAPPRLRGQVALGDHTCVFPYCTRPARDLDADHIEPYRHAPPPPGTQTQPRKALGPTTQPQTRSDNLAMLCRRHHRLKTFTGWSYTTTEPGTYLWRSPHGHTWWRDPMGTHPTDPDPPEA